ncbi:conjugative transposon protein TraJ [Puia dinghuensis]|nr:conjugative transposon protein TraJ [Puia dinghuensis]
METNFLLLGGLQTVLDQVYTNMLPMCSDLIGVGQALAGLAALTYIGIRVGKHIAAAEAVEVFPLLRPFAISLVIFFYPAFVDLLNGVLSPTVKGTADMVTNANAAIATLLQQKEDALKNTLPYQLYVGADGSGNEALWDTYTGSVTADPLSQLTSAFFFQLSKAYYNLKNSIKVWLSEILQLLYEAAALCINTVRTFHLLVLAILGPLVLGLSVFDSFRHSLKAWLARYIQIFLWLPVANIFGAILANIQAQMIQLDIQQLQASGATTFSSTDAGYMIFLIIGICGYFTVPSVAGYIVQAAGSDALLGKINAGARMVVGGAMAAGKAVAGGVMGVGGVIAGGGRSRSGSGWSGKGGSGGGSAGGRGGSHRNKIAGG